MRMLRFASIRKRENWFDRLTLGFNRQDITLGKSRAAYWDGRNSSGELMASGVYFYQSITAESAATRKMVIREIGSCDICNARATCVLRFCAVNRHSEL